MNKYKETLEKIDNMICYWESENDGSEDDEIELLKELVKRATPKKLDMANNYYFFCPSCKEDKKTDSKENYCHKCGQALDWGNENE